MENTILLYNHEFKLFSAKKRKLLPVAEDKLLQFKSIERTGDNVAILNKKLYETYLVPDPSDSRKCNPSWKIHQMKACVGVYNSNFTAYDGGHKAMEFLFAKLSSTEQPCIKNLKSFFETIPEKYGDLIKCTEIHLVSLTGHEVWLIQDYDEGPGESLWFRQVYKLSISTTCI